MYFVSICIVPWGFHHRFVSCSPSRRVHMKEYVPLLRFLYVVMQLLSFPLNVRCCTTLCLCTVGVGVHLELQLLSAGSVAFETIRAQEFAGKEPQVLPAYLGNLTVFVPSATFPNAYKLRTVSLLHLRRPIVIPGRPLPASPNCHRVHMMNGCLLGGK